MDEDKVFTKFDDILRELETDALKILRTHPDMSNDEKIARVAAQISMRAFFLMHQLQSEQVKSYLDTSD